MFLVTEHTPSGDRHYIKNDVKDIGDLVLNITSREDEAEKAILAASEMGFGGLHQSCFYRIECLREKDIEMMLR